MKVHPSIQYSTVPTRGSTTAIEITNCFSESHTELKRGKINIKKRNEFVEIETGVQKRKKNRKPRQIYGVLGRNFNQNPANQWPTLGK